MRKFIVAGSVWIGLTLGFAPAIAQGPVGQDAIRALEAEQAYIRSVLKQAEDPQHIILILPMPGPEGSLFDLPVAINSDWCVARLTSMVIEGKLTPQEMAKMVAGARALQAKRRAELQKRLLQLADLIRKIRLGTKPVGPQAKGFWQMKDGYPKLNPLGLKWQYGRNKEVECDIGESAVTWHSKSLHGTTRATTHEYTATFNLTRLPTTIEAGGEVAIKLDASCAYQKEGGDYTGEDGVLTWKDLEFVSATPPLKGVAGSKAARVRVGHWGGRVLSDSRTVKLTAPKSGTEITLSFGLFGRGDMIYWVWRWVEL